MESKLTLVCSKCGLEKLTEEFNKRKSRKKGFGSHCKDCRKIYNRDNKERVAETCKKWYEKNREQQAEIGKKYRDENKESIAERNKKWREENKERCSELRKKWYEENKEQTSEYHKKWYEENKERVAEVGKKWQEENKNRVSELSKKWYEKNKERVAEVGKKWAEENKDKKCSYSSKRRAKKIKACPPWLTNTDKINIEVLFAESKQMFLDTGIKHHVDHIHPLNPPKIHYFEGEWIGEICGLELPCNLRVITESQNCSKSNKFQCYVVSDLDPKKLNSWEII